MKYNPYKLNYKNMNNIRDKTKLTFRINKNILRIQCKKLKEVFMKKKIKFKNWKHI